MRRDHDGRTFSSTTGLRLEVRRLVVVTWLGDDFGATVVYDSCQLRRKSSEAYSAISHHGLVTTAV